MYRFGMKPSIHRSVAFVLLSLIAIMSTFGYLRTPSHVWIDFGCDFHCGHGVTVSGSPVFTVGAPQPFQYEIPTPER
jgi:hypothetical protein